MQAESLEPRRVLDSTVVINEIMYNPLGSDGTMEFIELHNQLAVDMDISEWRLAGAVEYEFPDGTIVPGRGQVVIGVDPDALMQATGITDVHGPWEGSLANDGETIELFNNDERRMNFVRYRDGGDWPEAPDGGGWSLAKEDSQTASHLAENWTFSRTLGGTPGADNFEPEFRSERDDILTAGAPATAFVPTDDSLGTTWIDPGFDDAAWLQGTTAVGFDSGRNEPYNAYLGLDLDAPPNGQDPMPMEDVNGSVYIRVPFDLERDPAEYDRLSLLLRYEDGFVAYLNGQEWTSDNAPGRDGEEGELTWDSIAAGARSDLTAVRPAVFDLLSRPELLQQGRNVLAFHALNRRVSDNDLLVEPVIRGTRLIESSESFSSLRFSEIAAHDDASFFVEISNDGAETESLAGKVLTTNLGLFDYALPDVTLAPGETLAVTQAEYDFRVLDGAQVQLYEPGKSIVIDAREVSDRLQGKHSADVWGYPASPTPGADNVYDTESDVVINEVMYSAPVDPGFFETPPEYQRTTVVEFDQSWRYNQAGIDLGADWYQTQYAADDVQWFEGAAPLGVSSGDIVYNTPLVAPRDNDPRFETHYFQTTVELTEAQLAAADLVELSYIVDDAALIYINGQEVARINLPGGAIEFDQRATAAIATPAVDGPLIVPAEVLSAGTNVISVELHQDSSRSRDIAMALRVDFGTQTTDVIPGQLSTDNDEEWIELFNRGTESVDISGWRIDDAVDFEFPAETTLGAGEFLVIARDPDTLQAKYPDVRIAGGFEGTLSNHDDRIRLLDNAGNLADDVHYFETGSWPVLADGGGSSLELTDPFADNSQGMAWAASDHSSESEWASFSYRGPADLDVSGGAAAFQEFIFGLLRNGEFLIDDIQVVQDPDGEAISVLQNGSFDTDELNAAPAAWRIIGNHSGVVVSDPLDAANKVLHVTATGAQAHIHDHAETTFRDELMIERGAEYEISFRAKWINGNRQLHTRLFYNRLPKTSVLPAPEKIGTPGRANTSQVDNAGPTFDNLEVSSAVPAVGEAVTVTLDAYDASGVTDTKLHWRVDGGEWNEAPLTLNALGKLEGVIPGQEAGVIVQFYAEATDGEGASATYPPEGPDSRALLQVNDGKGPLGDIDTVRIIIMSEDQERLYERTNRMSNWMLPITLVHNRTPFFDVDVRQVGSRWIRPNSGYKVRLNPEQPFYGVHDTIRLDMNGMPEIVMKQMINRAGGGKTSYYDDIAFLAIPFHQAQTTRDDQDDHSHEVLLNLARLESNFLDEQFENGSDGTKWELDDVVYPNSPDGGPEGLKRDTAVIQNADIGISTNVTYVQGNDPEFYRAHVLIKNQRVDDRFDVIKNFSQAIHTSGDALFDAANEVMDVDLWMRHYANQAYFGNWDTYGFRRPKNLRFYQNPENDKIIPFFWDCDLCNFTEPLFNAAEPTSRLDEIRAFPHNLRLFWGHMNDYVNRSFNVEYVEYWANHYGEKASFNTFGGDETFSSITESTRRRTEQATEAIVEAIPKVEFDVTTPNGIVVEAGANQVTLEGTGWVDVRKIRLADTGVELDAFWPTTSTWQIDLPVAPGENSFEIEAVDFSGNLIGTETITVTSASSNPVFESLRVSEIHYNPAPANQAEAEAGYGNDDFEFVELTNVGGQEISLAGVKLERVLIDGDEQGVEFDFEAAGAVSLGAGESIVVAENPAAFALRYPAVAGVAGEWSGRLSNSQETLTLTVNGATVQQFAYSDSWHPTTDGEGDSLVIIDGKGAVDLWGMAAGWSPSGIDGGSPGQNLGRPGDVDGNGVFDSADLIAALQAGEFEDGIAGNSDFSEGDWNGDGDFTTADLVVAFQVGNYVGAAPAPATPVIHHADLVDLAVLNPKEDEDDLQSGSDDGKSGLQTFRNYHQRVDRIFGEA